MPALFAPLAHAQASALAPARAPEAIWYLRNGDAGLKSLEANASHISVIAPQVYSMDSTGASRGSMDPRMTQIARARGVRIMPLVMNPGFDLRTLHIIVANTRVRTVAARNIARICRTEHVDGIQLDMENIHVSDRDAFTAFARETADSVHAAGCELSAAVVPRTDDARGALPYHQWMTDYWRGGYDYKALASVLDFLSYMTYAQHTGGSTPGPVAGFPWMTKSLDYVLALGVPPGKLSLGIPAYSDYWTPRYNAKTGAAGPRGDDIGYTALMQIIADGGGTPVWNDTQKAWNAVWERNGVFEHAWIEDARAFEAKLALVTAHKLRGYSVWLIGLEDPKTWGIVGDVERKPAR